MPSVVVCDATVVFEAYPQRRVYVSARVTASAMKILHQLQQRGVIAADALVAPRRMALRTKGALALTIRTLGGGDGGGGGTSVAGDTATLSSPLGTVRTLGSPAGTVGGMSTPTSGLPKWNPLRQSRGSKASRGQQRRDSDVTSLLHSIARSNQKSGAGLDFDVKSVHSDGDDQQDRDALESLAGTVDGDAPRAVTPSHTTAELRRRTVTGEYAM